MLQPDKYDILPFFRHIKEKTNRDLYGSDTTSSFDKSPKGSVDIPIRPLVDLINKHSCYATLSSCSGRIALFDPNHNFHHGSLSSPSTVEDLTERNKLNTDAEHQTSNYNENNNDENGNGKGRGGGWLLVSHAKITLNQLEEALMKTTNTINMANQNNSSPNSSSSLIFKHEPLLLHIAASNVKHARILLQIALTNCGLRESGMIHTNKRITVAIRSHALALAVPLGQPGNDLYPGKQYLKALVEEANRRFELNERKIQLLMKEVKRVLFEDYPYRLHENASFRTATKTLNSYSDMNKSSTQKELMNTYNMNQVKCIIHPFPALNLWGHTAVSIPFSSPNALSTVPDIDLIVIGGFGYGPKPNFTANNFRQFEYDNANISQSGRDKSQYKCERRNNIYYLRRRNEKWDQYWQEHYNKNEYPILPREGHATCILPLSLYASCSDSVDPFSQHLNVIATFGGRASPLKPSNELFFYCHSTNIDLDENYFFVPNINGILPEPRWGHTFTALGESSIKRGFLAIIIGGRNENKALSSIFILRVDLPNSNGLYQNKTKESMTRKWLSSASFSWEKADMNLPIFHHCTLSIPYFNDIDNDDDIIFIFGGLSKPSNLMEALEVAYDEKETSTKESDIKGPIKIELAYDKGNKNKSTPSFQTMPLINDNQNITSFASTLCPVPFFQKGSIKKSYFLLKCGGVTNHSIETKPIERLNIFKSNNSDEWKVSRFDLDCNPSSSERHPVNGIDPTLMVHHSSVIIPSKLESIQDEVIQDDSPHYEMIIVGGGIATFAFGPAFSSSYRVSFVHEEGHQSRSHEHMANVRRKHMADPTKDLMNFESSQKKSMKAKVFYVLNKKTKALKNALEENSFVDKNYRITKADADAPVENPSQYMAVPVLHTVWHEVDSKQIDYSNCDWFSLIDAIGEQEVMYSSANIGRMNQCNSQIKIK